eukprot:tig00020553_g10572.t1
MADASPGRSPGGAARSQGPPRVLSPSLLLGKSPSASIDYKKLDAAISRARLLLNDKPDALENEAKDAVTVLKIQAQGAENDLQSELERHAKALIQAKEAALQARMGYDAACAETAGRERKLRRLQETLAFLELSVEVPDPDLMREAKSLKERCEAVEAEAEEAAEYGRTLAHVALRTRKEVAERRSARPPLERAHAEAERRLQALRGLQDEVAARAQEAREATERVASRLRESRAELAERVQRRRALAVDRGAIIEHKGLLEDAHTAERHELWAQLVCRVALRQWRRVAGWPAVAAAVGRRAALEAAMRRLAEAAGVAVLRRDGSPDAGPAVARWAALRAMHAALQEQAREAEARVAELQARAGAARSELPPDLLDESRAASASAAASAAAAGASPTRGTGQRPRCGARPRTRLRRDPRPPHGAAPGSSFPPAPPRPRALPPARPPDGRRAPAAQQFAWSLAGRVRSAVGAGDDEIIPLPLPRAAPLQARGGGALHPRPSPRQGAGTPAGTFLLSAVLSAASASPPPPDPREDPFAASVRAQLPSAAASTPDEPGEAARRRSLTLRGRRSPKRHREPPTPQPPPQPPPLSPSPQPQQQPQPQRRSRSQEPRPPPAPTSALLPPIHEPPAAAPSLAVSKSASSIFADAIPRRAKERGGEGSPSPARRPAPLGPARPLPRVAGLAPLRPPPAPPPPPPPPLPEPEPFGRHVHATGSPYGPAKKKAKRRRPPRAAPDPPPAGAEEEDEAGATPPNREAEEEEEGRETPAAAPTAPKEEERVEEEEEEAGAFSATLASVPEGAPAPPDLETPSSRTGSFCVRVAGVRVVVSAGGEGATDLPPIVVGPASRARARPPPPASASASASTPPPRASLPDRGRFLADIA